MRLILFAFLLLAGRLQAQPARPLSEEARRVNLETQVTALEQAFLKEDFEAYADRLHPDVVRLAGGPDALAAKLRKSLEQMSAQGSELLGVSHGAPSRLVSVDRELQCTLPQTMEFQKAGATRRLQSTLLAVSRDGGLTWMFFDTAGRDWEAVRRLLPSLSRDIVLPAPGNN